MRRRKVPPWCGGLFLALLLLCAACAALADDELDSPISINTNILSEVLDRLTNKTTYDKRLRPRYGDKPVDVGITIHVSSISAVSEVDMDFTLDFYMRQTWQDPRLAFGQLDLGLENKIESLTVGVDYLDKLWKPDTFFPNEKKSFFHTATTHNSFLRIDSDGTVYTSQRLTVTATCPMKLQLFPMDSQRCKLEIESYGYTTATIHYHWCGRSSKCAQPVKVEPVELPTYRFAQLCVNTTLATTASGSYSRLWAIFVLDRESGFYMLQIFVPAGLVVAISWVSFWISRDSPPSRTVIGVMTVLTETHLMTGTNRRLPPVAYIKAVDVYLGFCYLLVVLALIEYACVAYSKKKNEDRARRQSKLAAKGPPAPPQPDLIQDARLAKCTCGDTEPTIMEIVRQPYRFCLRHSHIDMASRVLFPASFFLFNLFFWVILLFKAQRLSLSSDNRDRC